MRSMRLGFSVMVSVLVLAITVVAAQWPVTPDALAQEGGDQCELLASDALATAREACADLKVGEACFGHAGVSTADGTLVASGDRVSVADLDNLATSAANVEVGEWGVAMLALPANLSEGNAITAVLYGDAQMVRPVQTVSDRATVTISNGGTAPLNLRNGAGITYELVGQLESGASAVADGRNEQADWARIQFGDVMAWVFTPLIEWEGDQADLLALEVLLPNDVTPPVITTEGPFQAFTLATAESACEAAPSGLLLQYNGEEVASLMVNQATLDFSDATLQLTAVANEALEVKVLTGSVTVTARGIPEEATVGEAVSVSLGGGDGTIPTAPPVVLGSYTFPEVAYAPLDLLPSQTACMAGVPANNDIVQLRVGPGTQRGSIGTMNANVTFAVIGWANDPDGNPWWQLDTGENSSWVDQSDVRLMGDCAMVAEVEPPPLVFAPGSAPPATGGEGSGDTSVAPDFSPATNTVWQMVPGTDNLSGQCSGAPAINFCDHLAAIAPAQGGITWRGMEPSPYFLTRVQPNVYAFSGPNVLNTGTINLTLTFTGEANLKMTMSLVLSSEPDCTHVYYYTGTKNW
jgi:hypothetical protein